MTLAHIIQIAVLLAIDLGAALFFGREISRAARHIVARYMRDRTCSRCRSIDHRTREHTFRPFQRIRLCVSCARLVRITCVPRPYPIRSIL